MALKTKLHIGKHRVIECSYGENEYMSQGVGVENSVRRDATATRGVKSPEIGITK